MSAHIGSYQVDSTGLPAGKSFSILMMSYLCLTYRYPLGSVPSGFWLVPSAYCFFSFFKMSRYCLFNCGAASAELEQSLVESVTATDQGRALFKIAFEYMLNYNHGEFIAILCFDALLNWELDPVFLINLYDMAGGRDGG